MKRSEELRQLKDAKLVELRGIMDAAKGRSFTPEERQKSADLQAEIEAFNTDIRAAELVEAEERAAAEHQAGRQSRTRKPGGEDADKKNVSERYSLMRAIRMAANGKELDGVEGEMAKEAITEARSNGIQPSGNVLIPSMLISVRKEQRDLNVGTTTAGGYTVQTEVGELIPILEPRLMTQALGATVLTGLMGNVDFPRNDADAAAVWEGENDANAETSPTFDRIQFSPKRLGAFTDISKQLMVQSSLDVEAFVRRRLSFAIAKALDSAAINGSGTAPEPRGILNTSGIGSVVGGTNGAVPDWADIVDLETEVSIDDADLGRLAYLTTPGIRGKLKKTLVDSGSGIFIWGTNATEINGYRAAVSTQVPSTLTKGSASNCHAIIFGNWEELLIGQWAGVDIVVDPYSGAKNALVTLVVNSWWDVAVRHPASFAAMKDALVA